MISRLLTARILFPTNLDRFGPDLWIEAPKAGIRLMKAGLEAHSFLHQGHWFSFDFLHEEPKTGTVTYRLLMDKIQKLR